jgi:tetratricopeptide (TPR) repeat protein
MAFSIMLGEVLMSQRHWLQEFHDVMAVASSLAPQAPKAKLVAGVLNLYGSSLRMLGRYDEALEVLDRAVRVNQDAGDVSGASTSKSNIANVLADQRKVDEAVAIYLEDIEVCRTSDPPHRAHEAKSLNNLGAILAKAERFEDALGPLRQATEIRRRLGDLPGIAGAALNLGAVLLRLGGDKHDRALLEEAIDVLEEAATIFRQRGNVSKAADVANNLGQAQCKLGRFGHGIPNLAAALDYFERSGQDELAAKVRADLRFYQRRLSGY